MAGGEKQKIGPARLSKAKSCTVSIENSYILHTFRQVRTLQYEKTLHFNVKSMGTLSVALVYLLATHTILYDSKLQLLRL